MSESHAVATGAVEAPSGGNGDAETHGPDGKAAGLAHMDATAPDHHTPLKTAQELRAASHENAAQTRKADVHKKFVPAIRWMTYAEVIAYLLVAITLLVMAAVVIYRGGYDVYGIIRVYATGKGNSATEIIDALSNFLFVVILMELLATLITHIRHETFQIKPFLIIGIISCLRSILLLGARLSLVTVGGAEWRHYQVELGVNVGIDFALVVALVLLKRFKVEGDNF